MACPDPDKDGQLRYMRLDPDNRINEFAQAKKAGTFLQRYSQL